MFSFQVSCFRGYQRLHTSFVDCVTPDVIPHGFPSLMALQESKKTQVTMTWICQVATFADHARLLYRFIILWDCYNSLKAGANCKKKKKILSTWWQSGHIFAGHARLLYRYHVLSFQQGIAATHSKAGTSWRNLLTTCWLFNIKMSYYCQTSNISCTSGNKIVDHSDVVGASPVGAAPTTSSFLTLHLASMDSAKTTARWDEKHLKFWDLVHLILEVRQYKSFCKLGK